jgi:ribosomal protein S8
MKQPKGNKGKVLKVLREQGYITNFDCVEGKHGFKTLRLGAVIHQLKDEGYIELDEKSGYIGDTKNWRYILKSKPKEIKRYFVNGVEVAPPKIVW